jgi:putative addiction module killer protein
LVCLKEKNIIVPPVKKEIQIYCDAKNREPFLDWFNSLKDKTIKARIQNRLRRVEWGHFGDWKSVGEGVFELKLPFGCGYRIYLGEEGDQLVILLLGGDKSTQSKDIKKAHKYWWDYKENLK